MNPLIQVNSPIRNEAKFATAIVAKLAIQFRFAKSTVPRRAKQNTPTQRAAQMLSANTSIQVGELKL
jgi:hypothetical protein